LNERRFIEEAIQSVLRKTEKDFEVIVVDNGSADGSQAIIEK
jgi:glycosyltransferase involved in cell wall biosynthesis